MKKQDQNLQGFRLPIKAKSCLKALGLCLSLGLLAACESVGDSLGLGRKAPDEFAVIDRPPLSMPPDFSLPAPQAGAPRPQEKPAAAEAAAILGQEKKEASPASAAETNLLNAAAANEIDGNIRATIDAEAGEVTDATPEFVRSLLFFREEQNNAKAPLDATAEAARIEAAKAKGEPLTKGATPLQPQRGQPAEISSPTAEKSGPESSQSEKTESKK